MQPVGVDERMTLGRDDLHVFHTNAAQFICDEVSGFLNVGFVLVERADAGNAEKILEFGEETLLIIAGKIDGRRSHKLILSRARTQQRWPLRLRKRPSIPEAVGEERVVNQPSC